MSFITMRSLRVNVDYTHSFRAYYVELIVLSSERATREGP